MRRAWRVLIVLGGLLAAFVGWEVLTSYVAFTDDAYVRSDLVRVAPQVTGRVVALHVVDNQIITAGAPLLDIDPVPFQLTLDQRRAQLREAAALVQADTDVLASARDAADAAVAARLLAEQTQRRIAELNRTGDVPRSALDEANATLDRARAAVDSANATLARDQSLRREHEAARAQAEAAMGQAEWNLGRTRMTAPGDGAINNLTVRVGDTARIDEPLIGIVDAHAWRVIANYKQSYLPLLREGGTAWVWLDSRPWHFHRARIDGIARAISRQDDPARLLPYVAPTTDWIRLQRRFPVTVTLVDPPPDLTLYMGADARVVIFP